MAAPYRTSGQNPSGRSPSARLAAAWIGFLLVAFSVSTTQASEPIVRQTLPNGVRVVIEQRAQLPNAVVVTSYDAGSVDNPIRDPGLAELTHHWMQHSDGKLAEANERLLAVGALTATESHPLVSTFTTVVPAPQLTVALWVEAVRMVAFDGSAGAFDAARDGLEASLSARRRHDLSSMALPVLDALALDRTPPFAALNHLTLDDVRGFHRNYFGPERAVVTVVGPSPAGEVLHLMVETVGKVSRPTLPVKRDALLEQTSRRATSLRSDGVHRAGVAYGWRVPGRRSADRAALMVIGEALGGGTTSDVFVSLTTTRNWAFRVTSGLGDGEHDTVLSVLVESPRHIAPMDLATAVQHAATRLGSSSTSIQSAKKRVVRRLQLRLATPVSRAMTLADFELFEGDGRLAMKLIDKVQAVTADDVARVVQAHLSADRASMVECFPAPILLTAAEEAARVAQEKRTAAQTKDAAEDRPRQGGKKKIASPKPRRKR